MKLDHFNRIMSIIRRYDNDHGAERMEEVEKYAAQFDELKVVHCSSGVWETSIVVFIPFHEDDNFRGATMISVPQNEESPVVMQLYENNTTKRISQMIVALEGLKNELSQMQKQ